MEKVMCRIAVLGIIAFTVGCQTSEKTTSSTLFFPDLAIHSISAPSSATRGTNITVTVVTTNYPGGATSLGADTTLYLCTSTTPQSSCRITQWDTGTILSGRKHTANKTITIPSSQPTGTNYLIAVADDPPSIAESNEANNQLSRVIIINP
jgi:subtilase family serine protease